MEVQISKSHIFYWFSYQVPTFSVLIAQQVNTNQATNHLRCSNKPNYKLCPYLALSYIKGLAQQVVVVTFHP